MLLLRKRIFVQAALPTAALAWGDVKLVRANPAIVTGDVIEAVAPEAGDLTVVHDVAHSSNLAAFSASIREQRVMAGIRTKRGEPS